jgi:hypothetical protein
MFVNKRDLIAVMVLAALLFAEQVGGAREAPAVVAAQLTQMAQQVHGYAHPLADRAHDWLGSVLPAMACKYSINAGTLVIRCSVD